MATRQCQAPVFSSQLLAARIAAEKVIVTVVSITLMLAAGMTAYAVFMVWLERTVPWVLSVLVINATLGFVMSRFEKRWKKAEGEMKG